MPELKRSVHTFEARSVAVRQNWLERDAAVACLACSATLKIWPEQPGRLRQTILLTQYSCRRETEVSSGNKDWNRWEDREGVKTQELVTERRDWQGCKQDTSKGQEIVMKVRAATQGLENIPIKSAFCMVWAITLVVWKVLTDRKLFCPNSSFGFPSYAQIM